MAWHGRLGGACLAFGFVATLACQDDSQERARRVAEAERAAAEAEAGGTQPPPAGAQAGTPKVTGPQLAAAPAADHAAWAAAIAHDVEAIDRRSRQLLTIRLLHRDPRQKGEDLVAHMQWCDEGSLEACLHAGHVLAFNECVFDRAHGLYRKAQALAAGLPAAAVDHFKVDGQPQRYELQIGLRISDPANAQDEQRRGIAAVCGAIAERDRPHWDNLFLRHEGGGAVAAAVPSSSEESLALGGIRKELVIRAEERIAALEGLDGRLGRDLRERLAGTVGALCDQNDLVACATGAYLHAARCNLDAMTLAYQRFESAVAGLDAGSRALAQQLTQDVIGPARAYAQAQGPLREALRQSLCGGKS